LQELEGDNKALIFYESPHRVVDMLEDVREALGNRPAVVAREVTKVHEEFVRGSLSEVLERLKSKPVKGEITVVVGPSQDSARPATSGQSISSELEQAMANECLDERGALKAVARRRGISKSEVYRQWRCEKG